MCLTAVCFLPRDVADDVTERIVAPLSAVAPQHYYLPPAALHLTIKNVRAIHDPPLFDHTDIDRVQEVFRTLIPRHRAFPVSLEEVMAFETSVSLIGFTDERLATLVRDLDDGLKVVGVPDNKGYASTEIFFTNVTICRFTRAPEETFLRRVEAVAHSYRRNLLIESVDLISCNAVCHPGSRAVHGTYELAAV